MSPPVIFSSSEASTTPGVDQLKMEQASCESSSERTAEILGPGLGRQSAKPAARLTNKVRQPPNFAGVSQERRRRLRIKQPTGMPEPASSCQRRNKQSNHSPGRSKKEPEGNRRAK